MEVRVQLNNLRVAPRKARQVVDLIRNKSLQDARNLLEFTVKRPAEPILKLLNSAATSAVDTFKLKESDLRIQKITVDEGPKLKRFFPMSRGRAYPIIKRTSHITLVLTSQPAENNKANKKKEGAKKQSLQP